jgi:hypothetical protein
MAFSISVLAPTRILFEGQIWNAGQWASSNLKKVTNTGLTKNGACSESTYTPPLAVNQETEELRMATYVLDLSLAAIHDCALWI